MAAAYKTRNSHALKGEKIPSGKSGEKEYRVFKKLKESQEESQ